MDGRVQVRGHTVLKTRGRVTAEGNAEMSHRDPALIVTRTGLELVCLEDGNRANLAVPALAHPWTMEAIRLASRSVSRIRLSGTEVATVQYPNGMAAKDGPGINQFDWIEIAVTRGEIVTLRLEGVVGAATFGGGNRKFVGRTITAEARVERGALYEALWAASRA